VKKLRQQDEEIQRLKQMCPSKRWIVRRSPQKLVSPRRKDRRNIEFVEHGIDLRRDDLGRQLKNIGDLFRILRRDGGNRRHGNHAIGQQSFYVSLNPSPPPESEPAIVNTCFNCMSAP
jgi:hypothetical protein